MTRAELEAAKEATDTYIQAIYDLISPMGWFGLYDHLLLKKQEQKKVFLEQMMN